MLKQTNKQTKKTHSVGFTFMMIIFSDFLMAEQQLPSLLVHLTPIPPEDKARSSPA